MSDERIRELASKCAVNLGLWGDPHFDADVATVEAAIREALREESERVIRAVLAKARKVLR